MIKINLFKKLCACGCGKRVKLNNTFIFNHHGKGQRIPIEVIQKMSASKKGVLNSFYGKHHTEDSKLKISKTHKGKVLSEEHKSKLSKVFKGRIAWNKGKHHTEESKMRISAALTGNLHPWFGRHHSVETKEKLAESHKGKVASAETKEKLSSLRRGELNHNYGKHLSEETRNKISKANKISHNSPEVKARRRELCLKQGRFFKDNKLELSVQKTFDDSNILYEKHKAIIGRPDIFIQPDICIFIDGDYWHANPRKYKEGTPMYFNEKLGRKILAEELWEKDKVITDTLCSKGYKVFRFWEYDIKKDRSVCIEKIREVL